MFVVVRIFPNLCNSFLKHIIFWERECSYFHVIFGTCNLFFFQLRDEYFDFLVGFVASSGFDGFRRFLKYF